MIPESLLAANEFVLVLHTPKCKDFYTGSYLGANPLRGRSQTDTFYTCALLSLKYTSSCACFARATTYAF